MVEYMVIVLKSTHNFKEISDLIKKNFPGEVMHTYQHGGNKIVKKRRR